MKYRGTFKKILFDYMNYFSRKLPVIKRYRNIYVYIQALFVGEKKEDNTEEINHRRTIKENKIRSNTVQTKLDLSVKDDKIQ
jgi:hypothetical protein